MDLNYILEHLGSRGLQLGNLVTGSYQQLPAVTGSYQQLPEVTVRPKVTDLVTQALSNASGWQPSLSLFCDGETCTAAWHSHCLSKHMRLLVGA